MSKFNSKYSMPHHKHTCIEISLAIQNLCDRSGPRSSTLSLRSYISSQQHCDCGYVPYPRPGSLCIFPHNSFDGRSYSIDCISFASLLLSVLGIFLLILCLYFVLCHLRIHVAADFVHIICRIGDGFPSAVVTEFSVNFDIHVENVHIFKAQTQASLDVPQ